jgi:ABC-type multidrug transport system ATPase subunit
MGVRGKDCGEGLIVLLSNHSIEEAEALCQLVTFVRAGRIIDEASGAGENGSRTPTYRR